MNWLARGLGCRTRAGSRGGGLGGTTGRLGLLGRSRRDGWLLPVLLKEAREIRHLLLQRGDLSLQGVQPLRQGQQRGSPRWQFVGTGSRRLLGERGQAALMPLGQQVQILSAHPFFATIARMAVQGKLGLRQPAAQRFAGPPPASGAAFWHRCPGVWSPGPQRQRSSGSSFRGEHATRTRACLPTSWEQAQEWCRQKAREASQENSPEDSQDFSWEGQVAQHRGLAGFRAAATMIIAGPILMGAPKDRPLADQGSGSGRRPEEVGQ